MKSLNRKKKVVPTVIHDPMTGKDDTSLAYNNVSKRYDLLIGNEFVFSHSSHTVCLSRAKKRGVVWNK